MCRLDGVKYVGDGCYGAIAELLGIKKPPEELVKKGKKPKPRKVTEKERKECQISPIMIEWVNRLPLSIFLVIYGYHLSHSVIPYCGDVDSKLHGATSGGTSHRGEQWGDAVGLGPPTRLDLFCVSFGNIFPSANL